jgi:hypothetical protein
VRIEVTEEDIDRGKPEDRCACPVARAVRRAVGIPTSVAMDKIVVDYATPWQTEIWTPDEVSIFVELFDIGGAVEPFAFELEFDAQAHEKRRAGRS